MRSKVASVKWCLWGSYSSSANRSRLNRSFQSHFWSETMFLWPCLVSLHKSVPSFEDIGQWTWKSISCCYQRKTQSWWCRASELSMREAQSVSSHVLMYQQNQGLPAPVSTGSSAPPCPCAGAQREALGEMCWRRQPKTFRQMDRNLCASAKKNPSVFSL